MKPYITTKIDSTHIHPHVSLVRHTQNMIQATTIITPIAELKRRAVTLGLIDRHQRCQEEDRAVLVELLTGETVDVTEGPSHPAESPVPTSTLFQNMLFSEQTSSAHATRISTPVSASDYEDCDETNSMSLQAIHAMGRDIQRLQSAFLDLQRDHRNMSLLLSESKDKVLSLEKDLLTEKSLRAALQSQSNDLAKQLGDLQTLHADQTLARELQAREDRQPTTYAHATSQTPFQRPANLPRPITLAPPTGPHPDQAKQDKIALNLRVTGIATDSTISGPELCTQVASILSDRLGLPQSSLIFTDITEQRAEGKRSSLPAGSKTQKSALILACKDKETKMRILKSKAKLREFDGSPMWIESQLTQWQQAEKRRKMNQMLVLRQQGVKAFFEDHHLMAIMDGNKKEILH